MEATHVQVEEFRVALPFSHLPSRSQSSQVPILCPSMSGNCELQGFLTLGTTKLT